MTAVDVDGLVAVGTSEGTVEAGPFEPYSENNLGVILGAVFGSIGGILLLGGIGFGVYKCVQAKKGTNETNNEVMGESGLQDKNKDDAES